MRVSVVIPVWNGASVIGGCLESLDAHSGPGLLEVIAVDNASSDGSAELIAARHPRVRLLRQPVNLGFAGGVNVGLAAAQGDPMVLLNQDCIAEPDWLTALIDALEAYPSYGLAGCTLLTPDGSVDHAGARMSRPDAIGTHLTDIGDVRVRRVEYATGAALAIRRSTWDAVGRFDEGFYPAYYEEVDYCLRARRLGLETAHVPGSRLKHLRASTIWLRDPVRHAHHQQRARYRFVSKHFDADEMRGFFAFEHAAIAAVRAFGQAVGRVLAVRDTLAALPEIFERRRVDLGQDASEIHRRHVSVGFGEVRHAAFQAAERLAQLEVFETPSQMSPVFEAWQAPPGQPGEVGESSPRARVPLFRRLLRAWWRGGKATPEAQRLEQVSRRVAVLELLADYERR